MTEIEHDICVEHAGISDHHPQATGDVPHPLDVNYELLKTRLSHVGKGEEGYGIIDKYLKATEPVWRKLEIMDVWEVDRDGEVGQRSSYASSASQLPSHFRTASGKSWVG